MQAHAFLPSGDSPCTSLAVRITPELRQALLEAHETGQRISFRLSGQSAPLGSDHHAAPAAFRIGDQEFPFNTSASESKAELVQLPRRGRGGGCMEAVGTVVQKLGMQAGGPRSCVTPD